MQFVLKQLFSKTLKRTLFLFLVLILPPLQGTDYFVDRNHPSASDVNPGTESLPWLTIQKAADTVNPGDGVNVKPGIYNERVMISRNGLPTQKITFRALPRWSVQVLHGFNISADAVRVEGFDITHDIGGWLGGGIWLSGHDAEIVDNYIHHVPGGGVTTNWGVNQGIWNNVYVGHNYIYGCNKGISSVSGVHWLVEQNDIERLIYSNSDADYMRFFGSDHIIRGNYLHGTVEEEIGPSHVDFFQTYNNNGGTAYDILFEYNICLGFAHQAFMMSGDGSSHSDIVIRYNVFEGFVSWGVCSENIKNVQVYNNTWLGKGIDDPVTIHGVGFRNGSTGMVKNNLFALIGAPYWCDAVSSYECGNNLTFGCRSAPNPGSPSDLIGFDPLFAVQENVLGSDGIPRTSDDGLQLLMNSPAINAGADIVLTQDIRGKARVGDPDIGAYEFGILFSARVYLEGPYDSRFMKTDTDLPIPLNSPYDGTTVTMIPEKVVDWVKIELRTNADGSGELYSKSVFLKNDGMLADTLGNEAIPMIVPENDYYIVVKHRNHLDVMSADAVRMISP